MKREILEKFIGRRVVITMFDNFMYSGTLKKGLSLGNGHAAPHDKWYHIPGQQICFRSSHVKKIECLDR